MIFESVAPGAATGAVLAHSLNVAGVRWAKGRRLSPADVTAATSAGLECLTVARLDPDDVAEDAAATALASPLAGPGVARLAPVHGRVNLAAVAAGVCTIDAAMVARVNAIDEALTLATLTPGSRVAAGEIVATIKVIPYAVAGSSLAAAIAAAGAITVAAL